MVSLIIGYQSFTTELLSCLAVIFYTVIIGLIIDHTMIKGYCLFSMMEKVKTKSLYSKAWSLLKNYTIYYGEKKFFFKSFLKVISV